MLGIVVCLDCHREVQPFTGGYGDRPVCPLCGCLSFEDADAVYGPLDGLGFGVIRLKDQGPDRFRAGTTPEDAFDCAPWWWDDPDATAFGYIELDY